MKSFLNFLLLLSNYRKNSRFFPLSGPKKACLPPPRAGAKTILLSTGDKKGRIPLSFKPAIPKAAQIFRVRPFFAFLTFQI